MFFTVFDVFLCFFEARIADYNSTSLQKNQPIMKKILMAFA